MCIPFEENKFGKVSVSCVKNSNFNHSSGYRANKMVASEERRLCQCTNWDIWFSEY